MIIGKMFGYDLDRYALTYFMSKSLMVIYRYKHRRFYRINTYYIDSQFKIYHIDYFKFIGQTSTLYYKLFLTFDILINIQTNNFVKASQLYYDL